MRVEDSNARMGLRKGDDANLLNAFPTANGVPRLAVTLRLHYWSLPLSLTFNGHLICRRGFCVGIGPLYLSWSFA